MKFSDVIGNSNAVNRLRRMIDNDQMPHALLLHGPAGVPKLALARAAAQYIHCTNRTGGDSCGTCPSCLQHQSFNHADTFFSFPIVNLKKEPVCEDFIEEWKQFLSENSIEDYQKWIGMLDKENAQPIIYASEGNKIIRDMSLASYSARYKVLIMWMPEKMNAECANKLLKLIEEPSDDTLFILVSDDAKSILPTIFSRTQRIELRKPATEQIAQYLVNKYSIDYQDAMALAAPADGDIIQAERNMELDSESKQFHEQFIVLMRMAYLRNLKELKTWSETIATFKREKTRRFMQYCARQVRENFIYNLHQPGLNYLTREEENFSVKFAPFINEGNVERMFEEFTRAENDIRQNGNAKIILFDLAITITRLIKY